MIGNRMIDLEKIKGNIPTCIQVDWQREVYIHNRMLANPHGVEYPRVYQLETTSVCNLNCVFCPRKNLIRPRQDMSQDLFKTIADRDLRWTTAIELFGFGEPLCDQNYPARVEYLKSLGKYIVVASNCLLADRMPDSLWKMVDYLVIDVDAVNKEHYEAVRVGGSWEKMKENVQKVLAIRKAAQKYSVVQYIDYESEEEDKQKFIAEYTGLADEIRVKFLDTFAGQVLEGEPQKEVCCLEPLYGVSIWSNGDVVMCDRDFNAINRLGNVGEHSLMDIWGSDKVQFTQNRHKEYRGESLTPCDQCKEWVLTNLRNVPELTVNMFRGGFV
jgi:radical SAM protein with 4Fe4S-binding SPASM domain